MQEFTKACGAQHERTRAIAVYTFTFRGMVQNRLLKRRKMCKHFFFNFSNDKSGNDVKTYDTRRRSYGLNNKIYKHVTLIRSCAKMEDPDIHEFIETYLSTWKNKRIDHLIFVSLFSNIRAR